MDLMKRFYIQYCPDIFEGYHYRFEIYLAKQDYDKAEEIIDIAVELFPKDTSLFYDKIRLENIKGNYEKALQMIQEAESMEDFEIEARNFTFEKAKIYAQKEDMENTIKYLEKTVSYEADGDIDLEARYFLMNAYLTNQNYEKLLENTEKIIETGDESSYAMSALYYRALSNNKLGNEEEAVKQYNEALKIFRSMTISNPENLDGFMFRILCYKDLKDFLKALELVDYLLMLKEDSGELYAIKGSIYKELGNEEEAERNMLLAKKYNKIFAME